MQRLRNGHVGLVLGILAIGSIGLWATLMFFAPDHTAPEPESGTYSFVIDTDELLVGGTYDVDLHVQTDVPANTYSGTVTFPGESLEVVDVSDEEGIVDLWVEEPSYDNEAGTLTFAGGSLLPEFTGEDTALTFTIRATQAGTAELELTEPSLFAHDGAGTEIPVELESLPLTITD